MRTVRYNVPGTCTPCTNQLVIWALNLLTIVWSEIIGRYSVYLFQKRAVSNWNLKASRTNLNVSTWSLKPKKRKMRSFLSLKKRKTVAWIRHKIVQDLLLSMALLMCQMFKWRSSKKELAHEYQSSIQIFLHFFNFRLRYNRFPQLQIINYYSASDKVFDLLVRYKTIGNFIELKVLFWS